MADVVLTRGKTLPDSGVKSDLHDLIDLTTGSVSGIDNDDVAAGAAILGSKITPNFGGQDVVCNDVTAGGDVAVSGTTDLGGALTLTGALDITGAVTIDGACTIFGNPVSKNVNTVYQAESDGIVEVLAAMHSSSGDSTIEILSDSSTPPTTSIQKTGDESSLFATGKSFRCVACKVKKDDYYKVATTGSLTSSSALFTPLG